MVARVTSVGTMQTNQSDRRDLRLSAQSLAYRGRRADCLFVAPVGDRTGGFLGDHFDFRLYIRFSRGYDAVHSVRADGVLFDLSQARRDQLVERRHLDDNPVHSQHRVLSRRATRRNRVPLSLL